MRAAMTSAAVKAAKAIDYSGAGTIEFIVDGSQGLRPDGFWFMEMNTRLQVEHPVTEMVTGVDLVEWQLRVAAGEELPAKQEEIELCGHAFEARIYAEDPAKGFLPAIGTLHHLHLADATAPCLTRVETGVSAGDSISPYYDPMIAKLVVQGPDREAALTGLAGALGDTRVAGSTANIAFLKALAENNAFAAGDVDTGMIERDQDELVATPEPGDAVVLQALLAASGFTHATSSGDPWDAIAGYGHYHPVARSVRLKHGENLIEAKAYAEDGGRVRIETEDSTSAVMSLADNGKFALWPGHITVFDGPFSHDFEIPDPFAEALDHGAGDRLTAPMPGLVKVVRATAGQAVKKGAALLVLEAMKMEHTIAAPHDGVLAEIAAEGSQVTEGTVLARFEE
ncbi:MAG: biotin/lipoyl-containing protein [Rhizobiaceae bacterium]